jgi:peptide/nickel transport system substrate-binding protein
MTSEPSSLCPLFGDGAATAEVQGLLFRELVQQRQDGVVADLAVAVPSLVGRTVDWHLRDDAFWSDGTPVTARDVVAGFVVARSAPGVVANRGVVEGVAAVTVVDDHHVRVEWTVAQAQATAPRVHRVLPAHLVLNDDGTAKDIVKSGFCARPVGNGPFSLVEWQQGAHLLFARNPRHAPRAVVDEVAVRVFPSTEALSSALLAGDVDATLAAGGLTPSEAARVVDADRDGFVAASAPGTIWIHLDFNLDDPALGDVRVRRALAHAVDRSVLAGIAGGVDVADSFLPAHHWAHQAQTLPAYDPAAAARLLDDAGYVLAPGATTRAKGGAPLRLELMAASGNVDTERMLQVARAQWASVGVDVVLDLKPFKVFFGEFAKKRKVKHLSLYTWTLDESTIGANLWQSTAIPSEANGFAGQNFPGWQSAVVDAAYARADASVDVDVRRAALADVQRAFADELPALPLWFRRAVVVHRRSVQGIAPTGTLSPTTSTAATWTITPTASTKAVP